jgi:hypothetical protein
MFAGLFVLLFKLFLFMCYNNVPVYYIYVHLTVLHRHFLYETLCKLHAMHCPLLGPMVWKVILRPDIYFYYVRHLGLHFNLNITDNSLQVYIYIYIYMA